MAGNTGQAVLKRMAGFVEEPVERRVPDTPARTLRLALARAAERLLDLKLSVTAVADDTGPLDEIVTRFTDEHLHIELTDGMEPMGYAVFDAELRAAIVEMQMAGALAARPSDPRPVTSADAALCGPLVATLLTDLLEPDRPGDFGPWVEGLRPSGRIDGPRETALRLTDGTYRVLEFGVDLGIGGRSGELSLVLADRQSPPPLVESKAQPQDWGRAFDTAVRAAPANLTAVLYRTRLSLQSVAGFEVGTVLPLDGVTVDSLVLEGPGRKLVAHGRLGQVAGLRAVRISAGKAAPQLGAARIAQAGGSAPAVPDVALPDDHGTGMGDLPDIGADDAGLPDIGDLAMQDAADGLPDLGDLSDGTAGDDLPDLEDLTDLPQPD